MIQLGYMRDRRKICDRFMGSAEAFVAAATLVKGDPIRQEMMRPFSERYFAIRDRSEAAFAMIQGLSHASEGTSDPSGSWREVEQRVLGELEVIADQTYALADEIAVLLAALERPTLA